MAKRYAYTYTRRELNRRRMIGVIIGFPMWWLMTFLGLGFITRPLNIPLNLLLSCVISIILVILTWRFNTHQISKFTQVD